MARVGGVRFPKQFAQFEAVGVSNGVDGKPDTADDITIGVVPVTWSLEEYGVTYKDDDVKFVGRMTRGILHASLDGPNRDDAVRATTSATCMSWHRTNRWATRASAQGPLAAHRHRAVYMRWEPTRTSP
jgi:hypothetical protein